MSSHAILDKHLCDSALQKLKSRFLCVLSDSNFDPDAGSGRIVSHDRYKQRLMRPLVFWQGSSCVFHQIQPWIQRPRETSMATLSTWWRHFKMSFPEVEMFEVKMDSSWLRRSWIADIVANKELMVDVFSTFCCSAKELVTSLRRGGCSIFRCLIQFCIAMELRLLLPTTDPNSTCVPCS